MKPAAVDQREQSSASTSSASTSASARGERVAAASGRPVVTIKLAGKEYRIRSDANEEWLQRVASYVDEAMQNIRERTDTIDSLDIALLAALNLAREVLNLKNQMTIGEEPVSNARVRDLIEQIELELPTSDTSR